MTKEELTVKLAKQYMLDEGMTSKEADIAISYISLLIISIKTFDLPANHKNMPITLRALALILDTLRNEKEKA